MMWKSLLCLAVFTTLVTAGCTSGKKAPDPVGNAPGDVPDITVTATTGGIHGFVVDQAIKPIKGVDISVTPGGHNTTTNVDGAFALSGLAAGTYFIKASHPLYATIQQSVDVVAGVEDPKDVKLQLVRTVLANPYLETLKFDGFIVCSQDFSGRLFSEECGEGVGVQCVNPSVPCGRVGGQGNNHVQYDFYPSADHPKSIVVELSWEPNIGAATTGALWTIVATDFVCDPTCGGKEVMNYGGGKYPGDDFGNCATAPSYIRQDDYIQTLNLTTSTKISTFTWACGNGGTVPYDIEVNQKFDEFVTMSYYLPLPEGWSLVQGTPNPF